MINPLMNLAGSFLGGMGGGMGLGGMVGQTGAALQNMLSPQTARQQSNRTAPRSLTADSGKKPYGSTARAYRNDAMYGYTPFGGPDPWAIVGQGFNAMQNLPGIMMGSFGAVNAANQQASQQNNMLNANLWAQRQQAMQAQQRMQLEWAAMQQRNQMMQQMLGLLARGGIFGGGGGSPRGMTGWTGPNGQSASLGG